MKFKILYQKGSSSFKEEKSNMETLTINEEINPMNRDIWIFLARISYSIKNYWLKLRNEKKSIGVDISKDEDLYKSNLYKLVSNEEIENLIEKANQVYDNLQSKSNLQDNQNYLMKMTIHQNSKVAFFGDYHSSLHSLAECLLDLRNNDFFINKDSWILNENNYIVFTGDLVDRGPYGIECLYLVYQLFILNNSDKSKVIILNGNHEEKSIYSYYGFSKELEYQIDSDNYENRNKIINEYADKNEGFRTDQNDQNDQNDSSIDEFYNNLVLQQKNENIIENFENLIKRLPLALFLKYEGESEWYQFCHGAIDEEIQLSHTFNEFLNNDDNILVIPPYFNGLGFLWNDITNDNINDIINDIFKTTENDKIDIFNNIDINKIDEGKAIEEFKSFLAKIYKNMYFDYFINKNYLKNLIKLKFLYKNNNKIKFFENFIEEILIKKHSVRNVIFKDILQYVLKNNNIKLLISGHQDFANLGLVINDDLILKVLKNNIKLLKSGHQDFANLGLVINENYTTHNDYADSYVIDKYSKKVTYESYLLTIKSLKDDKSLDNTTKKLNLNTNQLLGIVTSSAVISRKLPFSIYGILNSQNITMNYFKSCTTHTWTYPGGNTRDPIHLCNDNDVIKGNDLIENYISKPY